MKALKIELIVFIIIFFILGLTIFVHESRPPVTAPIVEEVQDPTLAAESALLQATGIFLTAETLYLMNNDEASTQAFAEIIVRYQDIYSQVCPTLATPETCRLAWELLDKYTVKRKVAPLPQGVQT